MTILRLFRRKLTLKRYQRIDCRKPLDSHILATSVDFAAGIPQTLVSVWLLWLLQNDHDLTAPVVHPVGDEAETLTS